MEESPVPASVTTGGVDLPGTVTTDISTGDHLDPTLVICSGDPTGG
jgi:hypothetical protein